MARLVDLEEIRSNKHNLSIPLYTRQADGHRQYDISTAQQAWQDSRIVLQEQTEALFAALRNIGY
jgi:hypothetical protein